MRLPTTAAIFGNLALLCQRFPLDEHKYYQYTIPELSATYTVEYAKTLSIQVSNFSVL
jgi:hypothetical protein